MQKIFFEISSIFYRQVNKFIVFLGFFIVFFLYHRNLTYDRLGLLIFVNSLILIIFITSIYQIKAGTYIFIFFIPLLNSLTTILGIRSIDIILFLFFSLFMGFLINKGKVNKNELNFSSRPGIIFDEDIALSIFLLIIIIFISSAITIYRYLNFIPLLSMNYHNVVVNVDSTKSISAIFWTIKYFFNGVMGMALFIIIFNTFNKVRDVVRAVIIIICSNIIVISIGFYQHFIHPTFGSFRYWAEVNRINATFTDPNSLGNYLILVFPLFVISIIYFKKWYQRIIFSIVFIAFLIITLFTGSRGAFIGIILSTAVFAVLGLIRLLKLIIKKSKSSKIAKRIFIAIGCMILIVVFIFISLFSYILTVKPELKDMYRLPKTGMSLIDRTVDTIWMSYGVFRQAGLIEGFKSVSSERHFLWPQAVDMFTDYPITGVGVGSFFIELPNYYEKNNPSVKIMDFTGNYYLQIVSELGITGLILILAIFFLLIKKSLIFFFINRDIFKNKREAWLFRGFLISIISMIVMLFFGPHTNFNEIQFTFWLIIGLLIVLIKIIESNNRHDEKESGISIKQRKHFVPALCITQIISFSIKQRVSFIIIIMIFAGSMMAASWTGLSINIKQNIYGWENKYGLYGFEVIEGNSFRWSGIDGSEVIENNKGRMIIPVKDSDPKEHIIPLFIRFFIDNKLVKVVKITNKEWHEIELDLSGFPDDKLTFTISCSRSWVPKERGLTSDTRELGVMIGELQFIE